MLHGHTLLEPYRNNHDLHLMRCNACGDEQPKQPKEVWNSRFGCQHCWYAYQVDATKLEAPARVKSYGHTLLEPYRGHDHLHLVRCNTCGHEYRKWLQNLLRGHGCPSCRGQGFNSELPGVVYLIWVSDFDVKYGVTNLDAGVDPRDGQRVSMLERSLPGKLVEWWNFEFGEEAYTIEQNVGQFYASHRPLDPADGDGYTERIKGVFYGRVLATVQELVASHG